MKLPKRQKWQQKNWPVDLETKLLLDPHSVPPQSSVQEWQLLSLQTPQLLLQ